MPEQVRARLLHTLWGMLGLSFVVGLGCQAQVSYSILSGGTPTTHTLNVGGPSEQPADAPREGVEGKVPGEFLKPAAPPADKRVGGDNPSGIMPASYQGADPGDGKGLSTNQGRVSVMPDFRPADESFSMDPPAGGPKSRGQRYSPQEVPLDGGRGVALPAAYGKPGSLPPLTEQPEVKQAEGPQLPELPEFRAGPAATGPTAIKVSSKQEVLSNEVAPPPTPAQLPPPAQVQAQGPAPVSGPCPGPGCPGGGPGVGPGETPLPTAPPPHELAKVSQPPYMIEPPDILLIDAIRMIPRPPYTVQPLDVLLIHVTDTLPNQPIEGAFVVAPDGTVSLGFSYGVVRVAGMSLEMAQDAIRKHLLRVLKNPQVSVGLGQFRGMQQLRGEHLVRQDGTISLGTYGCVYVTGLTIHQAKLAIERHLSQFLVDPEVSVDVFAYNSKVYYIIADGAGFGQQVFRFPITGNETVLDAIANIQGLPVVASKKHIWVARPAPCNHACVQVLPVDWLAITQGGATCTNYQLFPGDRIYIKSDCLIHLDNAIAKIVSPIERLFGVTLLGETTIQSFRNNGFNGNGGAAAFVVP